MAFGSGGRRSIQLSYGRTSSEACRKRGAALRNITSSGSAQFITRSHAAQTARVLPRANTR